MAKNRAFLAIFLCFLVRGDNFSRHNLLRLKQKTPKNKRINNVKEHKFSKTISSMDGTKWL